AAPRPLLGGGRPPGGSRAFRATVLRLPRLGRPRRRQVGSLPPAPPRRSDCSPLLVPPSGGRPLERGTRDCDAAIPRRSVARSARGRLLRRRPAKRDPRGQSRVCRAPDRQPGGARLRCCSVPGALLRLPRGGGTWRRAGRGPPAAAARRLRPEAAGPAALARRPPAGCARNGNDGNAAEPVRGRQGRARVVRPLALRRCTTGRAPPMMTALITILTFILVAIISLWAAWPRLRAWIEQPKYDVLKQIRKHENAHLEAKPPSE